MKLSAAIRLGTMLKPQGFREMFTMRDGVLSSCAFGAAQDALYGEETGVTEDDAKVGEIYERFIALCTSPAKCPACGWFQLSLVENVVHHLNDDHRWSREQIADWIALHERSDEAKTVAAVDPVAVAVTV